jgi:hypothetical protein
MSYLSTANGPMIEGASAQMLAQLLDEYESILENELGGPVGATMALGIDQDEVETKLASRGLRCPDEVAVWFGWHNGTPRIDGRAVGAIPFIYPCSLDESLELYDADRKDLEVAFENAWDYELATSGAGEGWLRLGPLSETVAVNCRQGGSSPMEVRWTDRDFADPSFVGKLRAVSLCTVVSRWIDFARAGAFSWSPDLQHWIEHPEAIQMDLTGSVLG